jgi:DNA-binding NarL/FixJ family response regulator
LQNQALYGSLSDQPMIRVLLVDDHKLLREGVRQLLAGSDEVEVVGEAANGNQAIQLVEQLRPDVAIVDLSMPRKDGIEVTSEIRALDLDTRVLILTMFSDEQHAVRTLRAGASGFISKTAELEELVRAIKEVHSGRRYLPADIANDISDEVVAGAPAKRPAEILSKREFQVMCYLAGGLTNREIAVELGISVKTVDTHRGHVLKKLYLRNNADITRFAIRNGFVEA